MNWNEYFFSLAEVVSQKSKDLSTKVGAIIVGPNNEVRSTGFNGFPRKVNDEIESRHERPEKYLWTEHAERNAIYNAALAGISMAGCRMYLKGNPVPCMDCSRAVIQSGIVEMVGRDVPSQGKGDLWAEHLRKGEEMLLEAGIKITRISLENSD